jgi:hypothetical protein
MFLLCPTNAKSFEDLLVWQKAHAFVLARDLHYADTSILRPRLDEVSKMLDAYVRGIESNSHDPRSSP